MLKFVIHLALLLIGGMHAISAGAAVFSPRELMMPDARVSIVAENSLINGVPTTVFKFMVDRSEGEVKDFYKKALGEQIVENKGARSTVLGTMRETQYVTVKIDNAQGAQTEGVVAIADFSKAVARPTLPSGVPPPKDARLVLATESNDLGMNSKLFVYQGKGSVAAAASSLRNSLTGSGYTLFKEQDAREGGGGKVMIFTRQKVDLIATVTAGNDGASVVMNFVSAGDGK
jgi:hypothetical protein